MFFILTLLFTQAFASTCQETLSSYEIMERSLGTSIEIKLKDEELEIIDGFIQNAEKIYNPELEHFTTSGNQHGDANLTSETRLWFNFQLGNKRQRRGDVFRTNRKISEVEKEILVQTIKKEMYLAFIRNKQILSNYKRMTSLKNILNTLIERYSKIKFLSPEQKIEKGSLEISLENIELKAAELKNELELIGRFYQRITRAECDITLKIENVTAFNAWPQLDNVTYHGQNSLGLKLADLVLTKHQHELKLENSNVWPDLKIGPMWQLNKLANREYSLYGVGLVFPLPSFNFNQGMRQAARAQITRSEKELNFQVDQRAKEFEFRVKRYTEIKNEFKKFKSENNFSDLLDEARSLFKRGLISIPVFLSYKNEFLEVIERSQALEVKMAQHLMEIHVLNDEPLDNIGNNYLVL